MNPLRYLIDQGIDEHTSTSSKKHIRFTNSSALIVCCFVVANMPIFFPIEGFFVTGIQIVNFLVMATTLVFNRFTTRVLASAWLSCAIILFVTIYAVLFPFNTLTIAWFSVVIFHQFFLFPASERRYTYTFVSITFMCIAGTILWHVLASEPLLSVDQSTIDTQRWAVIVGMPVVCFVFGLHAFVTIHQAEQETTREKEKTEQLLHNILPVDVTKELIETGAVKPARYDDVTILFSDFKEFTNIVATIPTSKLVSELNDIFSRFDEIMEEEGVEKIQTIGDAYLAACGLPREIPDHALRCIRAAKKMIAFLDDRNEANALKWNIRIGIHSGPIAAGVVGKRKFAYAIFGDTINIASRIETAGEQGRINVSAYTYDLIKDQFPGEYRGKIHAKGKGDLDMYFV